MVGVDDVAGRRRFMRALTMTAIVMAGGAGRYAAQQPETPAPPGYWCPMHPDVRGSEGDRCRLCNMALVPIAPADYQPYVLEIEVRPRVLGARQKGRVHLTVRNPRTGAVVRDFAVVHERVFHLFVLSDDHEYFAHVHPELKRDGTLEVDVQLPRPGAYRLIADFVPAGGTPQLTQRSIVTAGYTGSLLPHTALHKDTSDKTDGNTRVKLTMPEPVAGREQLITFDLHDAASDAPARLEPYLGATGHLLLVSADLGVSFHAHPVAGLSTETGPTVVFQVLFPRAGGYKLWAQFQRDGHIVTAPFTVVVSPRG
jgi:hypothetical protein